MGQIGWEAFGLPLPLLADVFVRLSNGRDGYLITEWLFSLVYPNNPYQRYLSYSRRLVWSVLNEEWRARQRNDHETG